MNRALRAPAFDPEPAGAVHYPGSDGKPMAESARHVDCMLYLIGNLKAHFAKRPEVHVGGHMFLFYEEGNPNRRVSPDVQVTLDAPTDLPYQPSYKVWVYGKAPDFIAEITSRSTRREDEGTKRRLYARLGVREYVMFDPNGEYLRPRLKAFELRGDVYAPIPTETTAEGELAMSSHVLGLDLVTQAHAVLLRDPVTKEVLQPLTHERAAREAAEGERERERAARERAEGDRERERAAREAAEAQVARLQAEIEALRRNQG